MIRTTPTAIALALTCLSCAGAGAGAATEIWHLRNVGLSNGTAVTGSFDFDPVSGKYSDINIHAGTTAFGIPDPVSPGNAIVLIAVDGPRSDSTDTPVIAMNWSSNLTATGGTVGLNTAGFTSVGTCGSVSCHSVGSETNFASGSVTTVTPVPEPEASSWALLLAGLGFVGGAAGRRTAGKA